MQITNIRNNSNLPNEYVVECVNGQTHLVTIKINLTYCNEALHQLTKNINWLLNKEDAIWITENEYLIPILNSYEVVNNDNTFVIATVRYYIENHYDADLYLHVSIDRTDNLDIDDFRIAFMNYIGI